MSKVFDFENFDRKWMKEFIQLFNTSECLWKVTHEDYFIKVKRDATLKILLWKLKDVNEDATMENLYDIINGLIHSFRQEDNRIIKNKAYISTLWWYDQLKLPRKTEAYDEYSSVDESDDSEESYCSTKPLKSGEINYDTLTDLNRHSFEGDSVKSVEQFQDKSINCENIQQNKIIDPLPTHRVDERLVHVLPYGSGNKQLDAYAVYLASSLRNMTNEQSIKAKRLISDAIYKGLMNEH